MTPATNVAVTQERYQARIPVERPSFSPAAESTAKQVLPAAGRKAEHGLPWHSASAASVPTAYQPTLRWPGGERSNTNKASVRPDIRGRSWVGDTVP